MMTRSPIEEERFKLKKETLVLEDLIRTLKDEIEAQKLFLHKTLDYAECKTVDDREKHWKLMCLSDPEIKGNKLELEDAQAKLVDAKARLSEIDFSQRERQTKATQELAEKLDQFIQGMTPFAIAAQDFQAGAVRVETAVNQLMKAA